MKTEWIDSAGKVHSGKCLGSKNDYDVIDCSTCGFKHVVPIPTEDFLSRYYNKEFVKNRPAGFYEKMEADVAWNMIFYNEKFDLFEKYINKNDPSILDVGSGLGFFLEQGKARGWKTLGIEASTESAEYSRKLGLNIEHDYLDRNNYKKFGVIHMHEVLEHLSDPVNMVQLVKQMLNPGGLICIVSPNDFNPLQKAYIKNSTIEKWWVVPPEHINYFDFSSVRDLLENNGFSILEQTATFPLELFLLMGDNYIGNNMTGKIIHNKRVNLETDIFNSGFEAIRRNLYKKFSEVGIGREFCVIGKLNEKKC